jgi:hypothetical protein
MYAVLDQWLTISAGFYYYTGMVSLDSITLAWRLTPL